MTIDERTLVAYVDGELDAAGAAAVEQALAQDKALRETAERLAQSSVLLRAALDERRFAEFSAQNERTLALLHGRRPEVVRRWLMPLAACLIGVVLGVGGMIGAERLRPTDSPLLKVVAEVIDYHRVFSRERERLVEIPAARQAEFTAWLGERLGRAIHVPDLTANGLTFAGGRMLVVEGDVVAQMLYLRENGPPIAICIMPWEAPHPLWVFERGESRVLAWARDNFLYTIVGEASEAELRAIWQRIKPVIERTI
jgi:anti-sigma factor RsiW